MEKSKKIRSIVAGCLAAVTLATAGLAVATDGFKSFKKNDNIQMELPEENNGGTVVNNGEEHGLKMAVAKLAANEYEDYGVSPLAEMAYTLTATITPADATNKKVDWNVTFKNPSSTWAAGKTVTDYVTVTSTSDGALTATVQNLKAFGEQIIVSVTSRDNDEVKATVNVDYVKRLTAASVSIGGGNTVVCSSSGQTYTVSLNQTYSDGTIASTTDIENIDFGLSTSVMSSVRAFAGILQYAVFQKAELTETKQFISSQTFLEGLFAGTRLSAQGEVTAPSKLSKKTYMNGLKNACLTGAEHALISIRYRNYYGNETYESSVVQLVVRLDLSALATGVTGINVDKGSIIF